MSEKQITSKLKICFVVAFYWVSSISMTFANKYLVGDRFTNLSKDITIIVTWLQCFVTVLIVLIIFLFNKFILRNKDSKLPPLKVSFLTNVNMVMLVFLFSLMLIFNNITLKYVGISFFQIARSLTLIFTVFFTYILLHKSTSWKCILCCFLVIGGFILGIDQEKISGNLSVIGVICGVISSVFVALTGVFTKRVFNSVTDDSFHLLYYMNLGSTIVYIPFLIGFNQFHNIYSYKFNDMFFVTALLFTSILGFFMNLSSNMEVRFTSPTTHQISNNAKSVVQTIMAVIIFAEIKRSLWWFSNVLVVSGAIGYTVCKYYETRLSVLP